jgi:hypothetical protein
MSYKLIACPVAIIEAKPSIAIIEATPAAAPVAITPILSNSRSCAKH